MWRYSVIYKFMISAHFTFTSTYLGQNWSNSFSRAAFDFRKNIILRNIYFCSPETISRKHGLHGSNFSKVKISCCKLIIMSSCANNEITTKTGNVYQLFSFGSFIAVFKMDIVSCLITILYVAFFSSWKIYLIRWPVDPDTISAGQVLQIQDTWTLDLLLNSTSTVHTWYRIVTGLAN